MLKFFMKKTATKNPLAYQLWKSDVHPKASHISNTGFNALEDPVCIKMTNAKMGNRTVTVVCGNPFAWIYIEIFILWHYM